MHYFWWDDDNVEHIANHGIEPLEAEEILLESKWIIRAGQGKYIAYGQTSEGRYLLVVFAKKANHYLRIITARDMTTKEKQMYKRRK